MSYLHSPYIKAFLNTVNKSLLVQTKRTIITPETAKNLKPLRNLDGEIITEGSLRSPKNICSTPYEDCFERMSFEQEPPETPTFMRIEELRQSEDYDDNGFIYHRYSIDDIPLAENLIRTHLGMRERVSNIYYPQTDLSFDSKSKLKLMEFKEYLVPTSFDPRMKLGEDKISKLASVAHDAWENGVATNDLIRMLEKSVLHGNEINPSTPDDNLLEFLIRHPGKRNLAVVKDSTGQEYFDKTFAVYFDTFTKKYFADQKIAQQVLNECKSFDEHGFVKTVDIRLAEIAGLLRHRTAHGLPDLIEPNSIFPMRYCPPETPWGSKESEILSLVRNDGFIDKMYYRVVKDMLANENRTIDYVLENAGKVVNIKKEVESVSKNLICDDNPAKLYQKTRIEELLTRELQEEVPGNSVAFEVVKNLSKSNVSLTEIANTGEFIRDVKNLPSVDMKMLEKSITACVDSDTLTQTASGNLLSLCRVLAKDAEGFGTDEAVLFAKVVNRAKKGDFGYYKALKFMLEARKNNPEITLKEMVKVNLKGCALYMNEFDRIAKYNNSSYKFEYSMHRDYIDTLKRKELMTYASNEKSSCHENSSYLEHFKALCDQRISYPEFLEKIS